MMERRNPLFAVTRHAQGHVLVVCTSLSTRQLGCVFRIWSRRSCHQSYGNQSNVLNSRKLLRVTPKFETEILRSDIFAEVNLISEAPTTLQNLRIGLRRRQRGERKVTAKQCVQTKGARKSNILLTFGK